MKLSPVERVSFIWEIIVVQSEVPCAKSAGSSWLSLNNEVAFLVVGAYAMGLYGYPRATGDFDLWVGTSVENSRKIYKYFG